MKKLANALELSTAHISALFDGKSYGPSQIWSLDTTDAGSFIYTETNGISEDGCMLLSSSDSMYFYYAGVELYSSDFSWISYPLDIDAENLYGKQWAGTPGQSISCVKTASSGTHDLGGGRTLDRIENLYFPTIDGHGLHRKTSIYIIKNGASAAAIDSVVFGTLVGVSNALIERNAMEYSQIGRFSCGFDYDSVAAIDADWAVDAGITYVPARTEGLVYPNLIPDFDDASWVPAGSPVKNSTTRYTLNAGDSLRCWVKTALPVDREGCLALDITANAGQLSARLGFNSTMNKEDYSAESIYTATGIKKVRATSSGVDRALFVELKNTGAGAVTLENVAVQMKHDAVYAAPDDSVLSNNSWWNSLRLSGNTLSGKKLVRTFDEPMDVSLTTAVGLWLLPMNSATPNPGFRLYFKDELDAVHYSSNLSIWVDWNEKFPNQAAQFNYWDDGFYWEFLPAGVTQIKEIGIEILTDETIDWVLDDLFFFTRTTASNGPGTFRDIRLGLTAPNTRIDDRCLSNYITGTNVGTARARDKIQVIAVTENTTYVEKSRLSASELMVVTPNPEVYRYLSETTSALWESLSDQGSTATYTLPADCEMLSGVQNAANSEKYRVIHFDPVTKVATLDVKTATATAGQSISFDYQKKETAVDGVDYFVVYNAAKFQWVVDWQETAYVLSADRSVFYCEYDTDIGARDDRSVAVSLIGDKQVRHIGGDSRGVNAGSPTVVNFSRLFLSQESNTRADQLTTVYFHIGKTQAQIDSETEAQYAIALNIDTNNRREPVSPTPVNFNIMPHISFGGEFVAEDPMATLETVGEKLAEGNLSNIIVGGGSLAAAKSRVRDHWFAWGSAVMDNGISYVDAMRQVIRRGYEHEVVSANINAHRYLVEVTLFNYKWLAKHRDQIAIGPNGDERFKRVWYYETAAGDDFYVVQHGVDDFQAAYYDDQSANNKTYQFRYHYVMNYPALWSAITPGSQWGGITTIFDLWMRLAEAYATEYDTDGVIFSEYIMSYKYGCSDNDLSLYNSYRTANTLPVLADWVRNTAGDVQCDNEELWGWKVWQTNQAMDTAATMLHGHGKWLGCSLEVEPIISVFDETSDVWNGVEMDYRDYAFGTDPVSRHWHIRDLSRNCRRYGQDYSELFQAGRVDFGYVWFYHRYSPQQWWDEADPLYDPGKDMVKDFIAAYGQYKERLVVGIGLYPRRDPPPTSEEVKIIILKFVKAGFSVAYPGWPRIITVDTYQDMWAWFNDYVPVVTAVESGSDVILNVEPKGYGGLPFLVK